MNELLGQREWGRSGHWKLLDCNLWSTSPWVERWEEEWFEEMTRVLLTEMVVLRSDAATMWRLQASGYMRETGVLRGSPPGEGT